MSPTEALHPKEAHPAAYSSAHDSNAGMGGLVIGITVLSGSISPPSSVAANAAHKLQLVISENPEKIPLYKLEVNDSIAPAEPDKNKPPSLLGPPIILTRGEATEIEVKNLTSNRPLSTGTGSNWRVTTMELRDGPARASRRLHPLPLERLSSPA